MKTNDALPPPIPHDLHDGAQRTLADLMALPLEVLLTDWQRLSWWAGMWPLFRHMAAIDLRLPEIMVLRTLVYRSLNVAEVAVCICLSQSAASRTVDGLVGDGLIRRQEDPHDRRNKRLTLTPAGLARIEGVEQVLGGESAGLVAALSAAEQEDLRVLCARVLAALIGRTADADAYPGWAQAIGSTAEQPGDVLRR